MSEYKYGNMVLTEDDRKKSVTVEKHKFVIRAIFPRERRQINQQVAMLANGMPLNSYPVDAQFEFQRDSTLMACIDDSPDWWTSPDDCLVESVKDTLYDEIIKWDKEVQENLKKNQLGKGVPQATVPN